MLLPNEHLLKIDRAIERMDDRARYARLDRNERITAFPNDVFRDMLSSLTAEHICAYPDPSPLYARLSRTLGVPEDHLYLTNGSDAAIRMLFQAYVRPGDAILYPDPTYAMYGIYTRVFQGSAAPIAYRSDRTLDVSALFSSLKSRPRLMALARPDQPTGAVLPLDTVRSLAASAADADTLLLLDEAYYPFHPDSVIGLVDAWPNVAVTRTFSKVGGLAGLRLGYFAAAPSIIQHVQRIRGAHEVNSVAIAIGCYVLDHPELATAYVDEIERGRQVLEALAHKLDLEFPPCRTNFQLLEFPEGSDTAEIVAGLRQRGFLVKGGFAADCVRRCIRVTLAGPEVMERFAGALHDVCVGLPKGR